MMTKTKTTTPTAAANTLAAEVSEHEALGPKLAAAYAAAVEEASQAEGRLEAARESADLASSDYSGSLQERAQRSAEAAQVVDLAKADVNRFGNAVRVAERKLKHNVSVELARAVAPLLSRALPSDQLGISELVPMIPRSVPETGPKPVLWLCQLDSTITDPGQYFEGRERTEQVRRDGSLGGKLALLVFVPDFLAGVDLVPDRAIERALGGRLRQAFGRSTIKKSTTTVGEWIRHTIELDILSVFPQRPFITDPSVTDESFSGFARQLSESAGHGQCAVKLTGHTVTVASGQRTVKADLEMRIRSNLEPQQVADAVASVGQWAKGRVVPGIGRVSSVSTGAVNSQGAPTLVQPLHLTIKSASAPA